MLIQRLVGDWYFAPIFSLSSSALATDLASLGVYWVMSDSIEEIHWEDRITTGSMSEIGDRSCIHYHAEGNITFIDSPSLTVTKVNVQDGDYIGPPLSRLKFTVTYSNGNKASGSGQVFSSFPTPCVYHIPDHSRKKYNTRYKNVTLEIQVSGNRVRGITQYWESFLGAPFKEHRTEYPWKELDHGNKRYRELPNGSWKTMTKVKTPATAGSVPAQSVMTMRDWYQLFRRLDNFVYPSDDLVFGDLCRRSANDARLFNTNSIEFVKELSSISSEMKRLHSLLKGKATLRSVAKLHLSNEYGLRLTVADAVDYIKDSSFALRKVAKDFSFVRSKDVLSAFLPNSDTKSSICEYNYKIAYRRADNIFMDGIARWIDTGLFPTLQNSWDLIPFSFVVDWFTSFNQWLDQYDATTYWSTHDVVSSTWSKKKTIFGITAEDLFGSSAAKSIGDVALTCYHRQTAPYLPYLPEYFDDTPREFKNHAELLALIIANKRK